MKTIAATTASASARKNTSTPGEIDPVRDSSNRPHQRARKTGHDAGEDDQRRAVADAALRDLLAEPHQEHRAADQRDHRRDAEEQAGIDHDTAAALREPSRPTAMP